MNNFLVTGVGSGLGRYLYEGIADAHGLDRNNFSEIKGNTYDTIIHCAFNKEMEISDYAKYLDDNIFLTQRLKQIPHKKFVYISSVDVYQTKLTIYGQFKKFSESMMSSNDLILRCPVMLGGTMKPNHIEKMKNNVGEIGLSEQSTINYVLMSDLLYFFVSGDYKDYNGVIDFVSNDSVALSDVKSHFNSTTKMGEHIYHNDFDYTNPLFRLNKQYDKSSFQTIKEYYG